MKLKWDDSGMKTPQAKAGGLGSAKEGTGHWMSQRFTAMSNLPLVLWLIWSFMNLKLTSYDEFSVWLSHPVNSILMLLLILSVFYHAVLGSQVIVEDYVHHEGLKIAKLVFQKMFFLSMAVTCIFSVLKIAFGG